MDQIANGIGEAIRLLASFDKEIYSIIGLSLFVSMLSTVLSAIIGVPVGLFVGIKDFPFKKGFSRVIYTLMSLPPVVVGLFVALFLSRQGPLGSFRLMYTPAAMIIAQTILILPIIIGNVFNHSKEHGKAICDLGKTLGGTRWDVLCLLLKELRSAIMIALVSGLGRAVSEVGAVMLVGGNIQGRTRVMTTYIAMNNSMGNYGTSIAMGLVLLLIAFLLNSLLYNYVMGGDQ